MSSGLSRASVGLLVLGLLAGLGWGVVSLQRIFAQERAAATGGLLARRAALELYATDGLKSTLRRALDDGKPARTAALADPRLPAEAHFVRRDGVQLLPRTVRYAAHTTGALQVLDTLSDPTTKVSTDEPDTPWARRLALRDALLKATEAQDTVAIERAGRGLLAERARSVITADKEVPFVLAFLALLNREGAADRRFLALVLQAGIADGAGNRVEPLQTLLLRRRAAFTATEFSALALRVVELSREAGAPFTDFEREAARVSAELVPLPKSTPSGLALVGGAWVVRPTEGGSCGVKVDLETRLARATERMRRGGLLSAQATLRLKPPAVLNFEQLRVVAESPEWTEGLSAAESAWRVKTALSVTTALLAIAFMGVVGLLWRRRQHYLQLKSDFVSTVSHELRTPLASIRLMAETLERRLAAEPRAKDYPSRILRVVDGLSFLVENILSFNRIDKGRWVLRRARTALAEVLNHAKQAVELHSARPVSCVVEGAEGVVLDGDAALLKLLFENLLRNAAAYNDAARPQIVVRVEVEARSILVHVEDNGVGIDPSVQKHIFTPFYRAPGASKRRGSGLGLAICRRIAKLHGGELRLGCSSPAGSTFVVRLAARTPSVDQSTSKR